MSRDEIAVSDDRENGKCEPTIKDNDTDSEDVDLERRPQSTSPGRRGDVCCTIDMHRGDHHSDISSSDDPSFVDDVDLPNNVRAEILPDEGVAVNSERDVACQSTANVSEKDKNLLSGHGTDAFSTTHLPDDDAAATQTVSVSRGE